MFRTDQYIEFGEPIQLTGDMVPDDMVTAVGQGGWVEPPAATVHRIRDELQARLPSMTPEAATWAEHRAMHLTAHVEANAAGRRLASWQDEVHAARKVRDNWPGRQHAFPPEPITGDRFEQASEAAELLEKHGLDGRDLGLNGRTLRKANLGRLPSAVVSVALFLSFLPFAITCSVSKSPLVVFSVIPPTRGLTPEPAFSSSCFLRFAVDLATGRSLVDRSGVGCPGDLATAMG